MAIKVSCDGCGRDITTTRVTVSFQGFEWGNEEEHYCSAPCLVGRLDASSGLPHLMREYQRNLTLATKPESR